MKDIQEKLKELFTRIPRRHTADNLKEMYNLLDAFEEMLQQLEANPKYEKKVAPLFDSLEAIRATVKKSNDNKASKKTKDTLFDEASGELKDAMDRAMQL